VSIKVNEKQREGAHSRPTSYALVLKRPLHRDIPVQSEVVLVTPDMASHWLDAYFYDNQRTLRAWHVDELVYALNSGTFKPGSIEFYHHEGRFYLIDGQHRLNAIVESGRSAVLVVIIVNAASENEVRAAYYNSDIGLSRPLSDAICISGVMGETGLTQKEVEIVASATKFIQSGLADRKNGSKRLVERNRDVRLQAVRHWGAPAKAYFEAMADHDELLRKVVYNKTPVAVGILTFQYQPERAARFWRAVAANDGLRKGSAEHAAFGLLATATNDKLPANLYARKLAYCWNAYMEGRDVKLIVVRDPKKPLLLKGTPYDGVQVLRYGPDIQLIEEE
jgi:hypothetical protein